MEYLPLVITDLSKLIIELSKIIRQQHLSLHSVVDTNPPRSCARKGGFCQIKHTGLPTVTKESSFFFNKTAMFD